MFAFTVFNMGVKNLGAVAAPDWFKGSVGACLWGEGSDMGLNVSPIFLVDLPLS